MGIVHANNFPCAFFMFNFSLYVVRSHGTTTGPKIEDYTSARNPQVDDIMGENFVDSVHE